MQRLISFEGLDYSGKTSQIRLLEQSLKKKFNKEVQIIREPGGPAISELIREILLHHEGINSITELLLYQASRAQVVSETLRPLIDENELVILDRYIDSTTAYQGYGRHFGCELIERLNKLSTQGVMPKKTFYLDISVDTMCERKASATRTKDRWDLVSREFYDRTHQGYLAIAKSNPDRVITIDGTKDMMKIHDLILNHVKELWKDFMESV